MIDAKITDKEKTDNQKEFNELINDKKNIFNILNLKTQEEIMWVAENVRDSFKLKSKNKRVLNSIVNCLDTTINYPHQNKKNNFIGFWDDTQRTEIINTLLKIIQEITKS